MNSSEINYQEKIKNFQVMTDNHNEQFALDYLTKNNWDESVKYILIQLAAQLYYSEITSQNLIDQPHYIDEMRDNSRNTGRSREGSYRPVSQSDNENRNTQINNNRNNQENPGFFSNWIVAPIKWIGSFFCSRDNNEQLTNNSIFDGLPDVVDNTSNFINGIKTKIGLLILYNESHNIYFEGLIRDIKQQDYIIDILVYLINIASQLYYLSYSI